ncbi:MAG: dephospho-CoA kinase [Deltaproteobacteria bacterium]|nr:dephospho-CoA kinase [Deltaproteobacteria bacterium]
MERKRNIPIPLNSNSELEAICARSNILLLGVTGGIASGKTTVADMLKEMGAVVIDFDILAREVVELGKPAWKEIVDYFGRQVLHDNEILDRKKLSRSVFQDTEKRERLESFTHPRISEEFVKKVAEIANKDPDAIIQAIIPLLFEVNLQGLVHRTLVVHIPRDKQIERLIERDGISMEEAVNILDAQLPIDEKAGYADYVIYNENSLDATRKQVEELWQILSELQRQGSN